MISSLIWLFQKFLREIRYFSLKSNHNLFSLGVSPVSSTEFFIGSIELGWLFIFLNLLLSSILTILLGTL